MAESFVRYRFEDLEVWKNAMRITRETYRITRNFPEAEMFALTDQFRRAATSVVLNIAEGSGQPTKKGFAVYIHRAKSSVLECVACVKIAVQEGFVEQSDCRNLEAMLKEEYFKLIALHKSIA